MLAFTPQEWSCWSLTTIPGYELPTSGMKHLIELDQRELQCHISGSRWLTPAMLRAAHTTSYEHVVRSIILSTEMPLSPAHHEELQQAFWSLKHDYWYDNLRLFVPAPKSPGHVLNGITLDVFDSWIEAEAPVPGRQMADILMIESIPECLLMKPSSPCSFSLLHTFVLAAYNREDIAPPQTMEQAIFRTLRETKQPEDSRFTNLNVLEDLTDLNVACVTPVPITTEMLAAAISASKPRSLERLLTYLHEGAGSCRRLPEATGICNASIQDLLRLQLSLQQHQRRCFSALEEALHEDWRFTDGPMLEVARDLGFESVNELEAARLAKSELVNFGAGPAFDPDADTEDLL